MGGRNTSGPGNQWGLMSGGGVGGLGTPAQQSGGINAGLPGGGLQGGPTANIGGTGGLGGIAPAPTPPTPRQPTPTSTPPQGITPAPALAPTSTPQGTVAPSQPTPTPTATPIGGGATSKGGGGQTPGSSTYTPPWQPPQGALSGSQYGALTPDQQKQYWNARYPAYGNEPSWGIPGIPQKGTQDYTNYMSYLQGGGTIGRPTDYAIPMASVGMPMGGAVRSR